MVIRFRCYQCQHLFGIGDEAADRSVDCPSCGRTLQIPRRDGFASPARTPHPARDRGLLAACETLGQAPPSRPRPVKAPRKNSLQRALAELAVLTLPAAPDSSEELQASAPVRRPARRTRQAIFIASVYLLAGWVGYYSGNPASDGLVPISHEAIAPHVVAAKEVQARPDSEPDLPVVSGRIRYRTESGQLIADHGSLILLFPDSPPGEESRPALAISAADLDGDPNQVQKRLHALGGELVLTDSEGNYTVQLPHAGTWHTVIFSEQAARAPQISEETRDILSRFFAQPEELVAARRVHAQLVEVTPDQSRAIDIDLERS